MKALALVGTGRVEVIDQPEPACGENDVIVRMRGIGLCGSDLSVYDGRTPVPSHPWVLGHEGGGEVVAVGAKVPDRRVGDTVVIEPNLCCFTCPPCRSGRTSACLRRQSLGINRPGIGAELAALPAAFAWPVPAATAPQALTCVEPFVVTRTATRRAGVAAGNECLVVGAGSQGLLLCQRLLSLGAIPYVVDIHAGRQHLAEQLGALPAPAGPRHYPYVFETSGSLSAFTSALAAVGPAGKLVLIGQSSTPVQLLTRDMVQRQLTITGSLIYDHPGDFADAVDALPEDETRLNSVVRAGFGPGRAADAFDEARSISGKTWIDFAAWTPGTITRPGFPLIRSGQGDCS